MIEYVFRYRINDGPLHEMRFGDLTIAVSEVCLFRRSCERKNIKLWCEYATEEVRKEVNQDGIVESDQGDM